MVKNVKYRLCRHEPAQGACILHIKAAVYRLSGYEYYCNACQKAKIRQHAQSPLSAAGTSRTSAPLPPLFFQQAAATSCSVLQLSVSCFQIPSLIFSKKMIPQNYRNGNFENNFPSLNNIILELVFFTLLWYHFCLCSEQIYSALYYLLANSGA